LYILSIIILEYSQLKKTCVDFLKEELFVYISSFFLFLLILSTDNYFNIFLQTLDKKDNKKMKKCVQ